MKSPDHQSSNPEFSQIFKELLGLLFEEPFALSNGFENLTLEEIGLILEEPFGENTELSGSYDSCKSTYCLMLLELELNEFTTLPSILSEKALKEIKSLAILPVIPLPLKIPELSTILKPSESPNISEKVSELILNLNFDLESEPKTALNEVSPSFEPEEFHFITPTEPISKDSEIISSLTLDLDRDLKSSPNEPLPKALPTMTLVEPISLESNDPNISLKTSNDSAVVQLIHSSESTSLSTPLQDLGKDYFQIAEQFKSSLNAPEKVFSQEACHRAIIQFSIGACEIEIFNKVRVNLASIWSDRYERIQNLLQQDSFKFKENISQAFESHEKQFNQWLYDGYFPKLAALHCLKYLTLTQSVDHLHPSVFELGTLFYFWNAVSNIDEENLQTSSPFEALKEFSQEQVIEIAFRLFRLDRLKANSGNFNRSLPNRNLELAQEDTLRIMDLINNPSVNKDSREVA